MESLEFPEPVPMVDIIGLDTESLCGDLRDAILDRLRTMPRPWPALSENDQREMILSVDNMAANLVRGAVQLVATRGRTAVQAILEQCTVKDGIKAVLTMSAHDPQRHDLIDAVNKPVIVVVADAAEFMGEKVEARPDPDQPKLPNVDPEE